MFDCSIIKSDSLIETFGDQIGLILKCVNICNKYTDIIKSK